MLALHLVLIIVLVALSGLFSGLTLGLMALKPHELRRKMRMGNQNAAAIFPVRKDGNFLLCVLLLGNVLVNSILSIFLGSLTSGILATILATTLIVVFGEILPQASFSRHAMRFGAKMIPLVKVFSFILYPVAKPLALALDRWLGRELPTVYTKKELQYLLAEQASNSDSDVRVEDFALVANGLAFTNKKVKDVMTPRKHTFFLEKSSELSPEMMRLLHDEGYSRVPVYEKSRDNIVGVLFAKDLISVDPDDHILVSTVMRKRSSYVNGDITLTDVLRRFRERRTHLFVVREQKHVLGIITLEDVLEELVGEIEDEHDE